MIVTVVKSQYAPFAEQETGADIVTLAQKTACYF